MSRSLRPVTPTGSPSVDAEDLSPEIAPTATYSLYRPSTFLAPILERQDPAGLVAIGFFALSSVSTALVWTIAAGIFPMEHYHVASLFIRHVGKAFYAIGLGFGLLSERRLPRWLSTYLLTVAVIWYGWDAIGLRGGIYPWNIISHTVLGAVVAVPALLAHAWRRWKGTP
jgi:hypothetical protein